MAKTKYEQIKKMVDEQAILCGRNPQEVRLIAVSKTVDASVALCAFNEGARDFGENRPELLSDKAACIPQANFHFIGNIQSRRIPQIVQSATLIHSLFQISHAQKIQTAACEFGKIQDVLIEVNISGEQSKGGCSASYAKDLVLSVSEFSNICVRGLMTMAPQGDSHVARECFEQLAVLKDDIRGKLGSEQAKCFTELSMGMSEDWQQAVAAGSTMVRIGRAIFSDTFSLV